MSHYPGVSQRLRMTGASQSPMDPSSRWCQPVSATSRMPWSVVQPAYHLHGQDPMHLRLGWPNVSSTAEGIMHEPPHSSENWSARYPLPTAAASDLLESGFRQTNLISSSNALQQQQRQSLPNSPVKGILGGQTSCSNQVGRSALTEAKPQPVVYHGDPCTSKQAMMQQQYSHNDDVPSSVYARSKRKHRLAAVDASECDSASRSKLFVTERMVARMGGLSLTDRRVCHYRRWSPFGARPSGFGSARSYDEDDDDDDDDDDDEDDYKYLNTDTANTLSDKLNENDAFNKVCIDDALRLSNELLCVSDASSFEQRLASDVLKKSTMALVPWTPPLSTVQNGDTITDVDGQTGTPDDAACCMEM